MAEAKFPKITEEGLADLRKRIGVKVENTIEPWNYEASRDAIRHYAHGIGDDNPPGPRHVDQAGNAERRFAPKFKRIAIGIVLPAQDDVHALETAQGFQIDSFATDRQILPFNQRKTEVTGQVGVFETGVVVRPGGEQHHVGRRVTFDRRQR